MAQNYMRNYIVLTQENSDYTISDKTALGKCIIESKNGSGKVTLGVQNMKPGAVCPAFIVANENDKSTGIEIGRIIPDDKGKGEIKFECNPNDVNNSGLSLKDFNMAGIVFVKENGISTPLFGYLKDEAVWKSNFTVYKKRSFNDAAQNPVENSEAPKEILPETTDYNGDNNNEIQETETDIDINSAEVSENSNEGIDESDTLSKDSENSEKEDSADFPEPIQTEEKFTETVRQINNKLKATEENEQSEKIPAELKESIEKQNQTNRRTINQMFRNSPNMRPFKNKEENISWIRLTPNELKYFPDDIKIISNDKFLHNCYKKFNHIIMGLVTETEEIVLILGIPDIYSENNIPEAKAAGMEFFKCCDCTQVNEAKHGYWLKTYKF